jgi:hypothetical protein
MRQKNCCVIREHLYGIPCKGCGRRASCMHFIEGVAFCPWCCFCAEEFPAELPPVLPIPQRTARDRAPVLNFNSLERQTK